MLFHHCKKVICISYVVLLCIMRFHLSSPSCFLSILLNPRSNIKYLLLTINLKTLLFTSNLQVPCSIRPLLLTRSSLSTTPHSDPLIPHSTPLSTQLTSFNVFLLLHRVVPRQPPLSHIQHCLSMTTVSSSSFFPLSLFPLKTLSPHLSFYW